MGGEARGRGRSMPTGLAKLRGHLLQHQHGHASARYCAAKC